MQGGGDLCIHEFILQCVFADGYINNTLIMGNQPIIGIPWFLPALFWCRMLYNSVDNSKYPVTLSILISVLSYVVGRYLINLPFGFLEGGQAVVFYMAGFYYKSYKCYLQKKIVVFAMFLLWAIHYLVGGFSLADFSYGFYPINVLGAISACFIMLSYSSHYCTVYNDSLIMKFLIWCGINSMTIFCVHSLWLDICPFGLWPFVMCSHLIVCTLLAYFYSKVKSKKYE